MSQTATPRREAVGDGFSLQAMRTARALTFDAVHQIAAAVSPGMTEARAHEIAEEILIRMGMQRLWHKTVVRFGEGTLATFREPVGSERLLRETDIFFVDLGVVWDGHEGDAGDTFTTGDDPEMAACAAAARTIWAEVSAKWHQDGLTGQVLYDFAERRARDAGWVLKHDVKGHRVSDFPHGVLCQPVEQGVVLTRPGVFERLEPGLEPDDIPWRLLRPVMDLRPKGFDPAAFQPAHMELLGQIIAPAFTRRSRLQTSAVPTGEVAMDLCPTGGWAVTLEGLGIKSDGHAEPPDGLSKRRFARHVACSNRRISYVRYLTLLWIQSLAGWTPLAALRRAPLTARRPRAGISRPRTLPLKARPLWRP